MKKTAFVAACLMFAGLGLSAAQAADGTRAHARRAESKVVSPEAIEAIGLVTYDTGTNAGFHPDATTGNLNRVVGNRFNSALGGPLLMTGMVTRLTVFPANSGVQSVSIAGTPNTMNSAMVLDYLTANMMAGTFNQVTVAPPVAVGADFLGLFLGTFTATQAAGLLGMSDMAVNAQGYHAVEGFYLGGNTTMITTVANRNAMLRAFGDILTPVELMDFKIQ